jgi:hypothetical protein
MILGWAYPSQQALFIRRLHSLGRLCLGGRFPCLISVLPATTSVMHTRQRDETENDRDISRIIETLATLGEIMGGAARQGLTNFYHFKDDDHSMAITVGAKSSRQLGFSTRIGA